MDSAASTVLFNCSINLSNSSHKSLMRKDAFCILRGNRQIHSEPMGSHKRSCTKAWKGPWEREGQEGVGENLSPASPGVKSVNE